MEKMKLNIQLFGATCTVSVKSCTASSASDNYSTIVIHCKLATDGYSYNYGGAYMQPTISNQPVVGSQTTSQTLTKKKYNLSKNDSGEDDWTFTVYHNDDGTCNNLTISVAWYVSDSTKGTKTLSGGYTPATIARASSVSATDGTLNVTDSVSISITRKNNTFTHTLRYVCGSDADWIKDSNNKVATSATWTPPLSLASQNTSGSSVGCTIYCQTYDGNNPVGSEVSTYITLTIPSLPPTNMTISSPTDYNNYKNTYGVFIQNKSRIKATLSGTMQYGTGVKSYAWQIRQTNSSGELLASGTSASIDYSPTTSGTLYISGTITDNRQASNSTDTTISVTAYSAPTCSLTVSRVDSTSSSYTMSGSGTPLSVGGYTTNVVTYTLTRDNTQVRSTSDGTSYTGTDTIADQSYTYILTASDTISGQTDSKTVPISTTFALMNFNASGKAMAIGKASEATGNNKLLEIAMAVDIEDNGVSIISKGGNNLLRNNSTGATVLSSAGTGDNAIWFRPNGDSNTTKQAYIDTNGRLITSDEIIGGLGYGQFRAAQGNYGFFIRNDGDSTYFMLTNSGDPYGSWNGLRPIIINNGNGHITFNEPIDGTLKCGGLYNNDANSTTANFRNLFLGASSGPAIRAIRNDAGAWQMPTYSAGIAFGVGDTHGYIMPNYGWPQATIGGGNGSSLNWVKNILLAPDTLYNNDNGDTGTIILSGNVWDYTYIEIIYKQNQNIYNQTRVYNANGKTVALMVIGTISSSYTWLQSAQVYISGNTISKSATSEVRLGSSISYNTNNNIAITKVLGYRE